MKISVALCTYNGSKYLAAQLNSIAKQSRLPDELVISDDASTDNSLAIASEFAKTAPLPVRVIQSAATLGSTENFQRAIEMCSGDVIMLSDQDDVWMESRVNLTARAFASRPELSMCFSDAIVTDSELRPVGRLWPSVKLDAATLKHIDEGGALQELLRRNFVTGATMAFARRICRVALPIPRLETRIHDGWLALVASALGPVQPIRQATIYYRQHASQQFGLPQVALFEELQRKVVPEARQAHIQIAEDMAQLESRLALQLTGTITSDVFEHLAAQRQHRLIRASMSRSYRRRFPIALREAATGRYRYSGGWLSVMRDLLLP